MSKALLIIDVQQGFLKSYKELPDRIAKVAQKFKDNNDTVIAFQHLDDMKGSPIEFGTAGAEIPTILTDKADITIQKKYPISFNDLDITDFIGTVMDWSELVTNKYLEETEYDD